MEAVHKAVGFYPVKVKVVDDGHAILVEPIVKSENKVSGNLVDEKGLPIEYATVRVYSPADSSFLGSGVTNSAGDFVVPVSKSKVRVTVSALGYMPLERNVNAGRIGKLMMKSNPLELKGVTVEAKYLESAGGKLLATPTPLQLKHSFDLYNLLGQLPLPGMFVDMTIRSIKVFNQDPVILVDGIERSTDYLINVRPKNVSKIEYITDIPAKYIDRRPPVVINIILKEPEDGGNIWANGQSAVNAGFINAGVGGSYNQGKSEISFSYNYNYRDYNERVIDDMISYVAEDVRIDIESRGRKSPFDYNTNNGHIGYIYRHSKTAYLNIQTNMSGNVRHADENADVHDSRTGDYVRHSHIRNHSFFMDPDIYFQKDWKEKGKLEVQANAVISNVDYIRNLSDTLSTGTINSYPSQMQSNSRSFKLEANYQRNFGKANASLGYRYNYSRSRNSYPMSDVVQRFRTSTNSVYGSLHVNLDNFYLGLNASLGFISYPGENYDYSSIKKPLPNVSLYIQHDLNDNLMLAVSSSYWQSRPNLSAVTDFRQQYDAYLYSTGNPDLKIQNSFDVNPRIRLQYNKFWAQANVRFQYNRRAIYNTVSYLGKGEFLSYSTNAKYNYELQPVLAIGVNQLFNGHFSGQFNYIYNHYKYVCADGMYRLNAPDWMLTLNGYLNEWVAQFRLTHPGRSLWGPKVTRGENHNSLTIARRFGDHWQVNASITYFLKNEGTIYPSSENLKHRVSRSLTSIRDNHCMVVIGFSYRGAFGRIFQTGQRTLNGGAGSGDYKVVQ